ncbi:LysR family transcriptional regulator [Tolypothrix campylonemoides VB511288]|nr:LysR family transcriptional regulator [Tolypothrix campylonemoides VB511288]
MLRTLVNELMVFVAVVDAGSFVAGGRATGLTRSAAAKAVARLEAQLGARLLHRTTRALALTDEGRALYAHGQTVIAAIDGADAGVGRDAGRPRGLLRLTVPDAFGRLVVFPVLRRFLETWPNVRAEVNFSDRRADIVEEGYDLALRIGGAAGDSRLVSRVVARYRAHFVAAPAYLDARGRPRAIEDFVDHDVLVFSGRERRQRLQYIETDGSAAYTPGRARLRLDSGEALRDAALAGLGIAYLPDFLVGDDLAAGRLEAVLPARPPAALDIVALYPSRRLLEPRVRQFIDLLVETLPR